MSRTPAAEVAPPDLPGYRFVEHIGQGGNAQVYLYQQALPNRPVAVKVLNESALSETARRRFAAEANVTAGLDHRHIVQVFDARVTPDGRPYLVLPYYPKPNLSVRARRAHFPVEEVLRIGVQIGGAVETSHRRQVLHRDIKPQNILTDAYGEPVLTDFGIATINGEDDPQGRLSVPWSPPEILNGTGAADRRSDVYSLGATLWHLLVGRSPFEEPGGDNSRDPLMGRIKSAPVPPTRRRDVPPSLERLLRQAMAKDSAARPRTAMELVRGLQSIERELGLRVTQPILPEDEPAPAEAAGTVGGTLAADATTSVRGPRAGARAKQLPPQPPDPATVIHSSPDPVMSAGPGGPAGEQGRGRPRRTLALAGGGTLLAVAVAVAVAVAAAVAVLAFGRGGGGPQAAAVAQATESGASALGPGATAPGQPTVTAHRVATDQVEFSWSYANPARGDVFFWRETKPGGGAAQGLVSEPRKLFTIAGGAGACVTVEVRRTDGQASTTSVADCWQQ